MSEKTYASIPIQHIEPTSLNDVQARVSYLKSFLQFTDDDGAAISASKPLIAPLLPSIIDSVYSHLISYDITAKAFLPKQSSSAEEELIKVKSVEELSLQHPHIALRKEFLKQYLVRMVSNNNWADDSNYWEYLDRVGVMHTGQPGFKHRQGRPELRVEYIQLGLLLGYVEDLVVKAVLDADLGAETTERITRAFNKLLWIQNDLMARHYIVDKAAKTTPLGMETHPEGFGTQMTLGIVAAGIVGIVTGAAISILSRRK